MSLMDMSSAPPMGGVKNHTVLECTRCGKMVLVPPGLILRIPANPEGDFCHETADGMSGKSYARG